MISEPFALFFGLGADDCCVGSTCEDVVRDAGLHWPCRLYAETSAMPAAALAVYVMPAETSTCLETLIDNGAATPLLYGAPCAPRSPAMRALSIQLFAAAADKLLTDKGFSVGSSPWPGLVRHPLLDLQVLVLHPHLEMYLALLAHIHEDSGPRSETLASTDAVQRKLRHFVGQTMGMKKMTIDEGEAMRPRLTVSGAPPRTPTFSHSDSLTRSRTGALLGLYQFWPQKWLKRNAGYQSGMREYVSATTPRRRHDVHLVRVNPE